ncbi:MAG: hypothetical protein FWE32_05940 [Oscillospiraceae bacterium]|nr:hypothetical protein [Oscillospiraceae bacterium]
MRSDTAPSKFDLVKLVLESGIKYNDQKKIAAEATKLGLEHEGNVTVRQGEVSEMLKAKKIVKLKDGERGYYYTINTSDGEGQETTTHRLAKAFYSYTPKDKVEFCDSVKMATLRTNKFRNRYLGDKVKAAFEDIIIDLHYPTEHTIVFYYRGQGCKVFEDFMQKLVAWRKESRGNINPPAPPTDTEV